MTNDRALRTETTVARKKVEDRPSAFTLAQPPIQLSMKLELAVALGDWIMENKPANPAIQALGHQLQALIPLENEPELEIRPR